MAKKVKKLSRFSRFSKIQKMSLMGAAIFVLGFGVYGAYQKQQSKALLISELKPGADAEVEKITNGSFENADNFCTNCTENGKWRINNANGTASRINTGAGGAVHGSYVLSIRGSKFNNAPNIIQTFDTKGGCSYTGSLSGKNLRGNQSSFVEAKLVLERGDNLYEDFGEPAPGQWHPVAFKAGPSGGGTGTFSIRVTTNSSDVEEYFEYYFDNISVIQNCNRN